MIKDITLGQYFPGNSILHRLDPRTKLISAILLIVATFLAKGMLAYLILVAFSVGLILLSGIPLKTVLKSVKPLIFIIVFTAVLNMLFASGDNVLLDAEWWIFHIVIRAEGVLNAVKMAIRIILLVVNTSVVLTYTTSPIDLTFAIEKLLTPLAKIKVPVHSFAMMMSLALRFIPTLVEETDKIIAAQKSRGADFSSGNLISRIKALIPILIPLLLSSFRRADELALAMECRCYHGGTGRTRMKVTAFHRRDYLFLLVMVLFLGIRLVPSFHCSTFGIENMDFLI